MGWLGNIIDRITGADGRARRRLVHELATSPGVSRQRTERIATRLGVDAPIESERRWDSGKTNRLNSGHWSALSGQPVNADISAWLGELRRRSEYELANNPLVEGMVQTYQLCVVGSEGPQLSLLTSDADYQAARAAVWAEWSKHAGSNQQLSMVEILDQWIRSLFAAGEFLTQIIDVPDAEGPVKLRLLPIHARRLATPPAFIGNPEVALGVRRDLDNRRPVSYFIEQPKLMGPFELSMLKYDELPYQDLLHGFRMIEEDQVRGIPWLASCLDSVAEMRDFKNETLDAARAAADFSIVLSTTSPDIPGISINETSSIERRTIRSMPPGWTPSQMAPAHPGPQYGTFYESLAREIGGPICMPLMMLLLDSSSHNYSSARFDGQMFWRGVVKNQGWLGRMLSRIESLVAQEAELNDLLPPPPPDLQRTWIWPKAPHVDPVKEATAERLYMENGTLSYAEACASHNKSPEQMIASRKRDNQMLVDAGLPTIPGWQQPMGGAPPEQQAGAAPTEDDE